MATHIPLDARLKFTDQLMFPSVEEAEDFRLERKATLRTVLGGDVDSLDFSQGDDSVSLTYEITLAQAFELDLEPEVITRYLVTQAGMRGRFEDLVAQVEGAKEAYRALEDQQSHHARPAMR